MIYTAPRATTEKIDGTRSYKSEYQSKEYPCGVDKFRRAEGCKEKTVSNAGNK